VHLAGGAFKQASAAAGHQAVGGEDEVAFREVEGDVAEGMAGDVNDAGGFAADGEAVVFGQGKVEAREAAGPVGTEIRVEDLFYNVPARRKFLKRAATEASHVQDAVQRLALCYPEVAFRLVKDGRVAFDLPRHGSLLDRVRAIYGATIASRLAPVQVDGVFGIDGLIGPPDEARSTARHYHTFVNGRFVRDRVVMAAVQSAYGSRLDRSRHPFVVLRVRMPPEALDVNVHPAKTEVRFVESGGVHRLVAGAIDRTLREEPWSERGAEGAGRRFALGGAVGVVEGDGAAGGEGAGIEEAGGLTGHRQRIFDAMERITARRSGVASRVEAPRTAQFLVPASQKVGC
jgi:DNA mismatch repair protein MutL